MEGNTYHCDLNPESFFNKNDLKDHHLVHKERIKLYCDVCLLEFFDEAELERHYLIHKTESISLDKDSFNHIRKNPFVCLHCDETFSQKCLLEKHLFSHTGGQLPCPLCSKYFEKEELQMHLQVHKERNKMPKRHFVCNICRKGFRFRIALKHHIKVHQNKECNKCGNMFSNSLSLAKHTCLSPKKEFPCDSCSSVFISEMKLNSHKRRVHTRQVYFPCDKCKRECYSQYDLERHAEASLCLYSAKGGT